MPKSIPVVRHPPPAKAAHAALPIRSTSFPKAASSAGDERRIHARENWANYSSMENTLGMPTEWDPHPLWRLWKLEIYINIKENVRHPMGIGWHLSTTYWCMDLEHVKVYYNEWKDSRGRQILGVFNHVRMAIIPWAFNVADGMQDLGDAPCIIMPKAPPVLRYPLAQIQAQGPPAKAAPAALFSQEPPIQPPPPGLPYPPVKSMPFPKQSSHVVQEQQRHDMPRWPNYLSMENTLGMPTEWDPRPIWRLWRLEIFTGSQESVTHSSDVCWHLHTHYWCTDLDRTKDYYTYWKRCYQITQGQFNHVRIFISSWTWDVIDGIEQGGEEDWI